MIFVLAWRSENRVSESTAKNAPRRNTESVMFHELILYALCDLGSETTFLQ